MIEPEWKFKTVDENNVTEVAKTFNLPRTIARVMSIKGLCSRSDSKIFFYPDIQHLHDPFLMKDMDKAVERILTIISNKKTMVIFAIVNHNSSGRYLIELLNLFVASRGVVEQ